MSVPDKPLVFLSAEITTPPLSTAARREAGYVLACLQKGRLLSLPHSRPMTRSIGARCHELRIQDENATWRILYRIDQDKILILDVFSKKSQAKPLTVIAACRRRLKRWDGR